MAAPIRHFERLGFRFSAIVDAKACSFSHSAPLRSDEISKGFTQRVFSAVQATGVPHLGNYLGALQNWVALQDRHKEPIFSIADLHSLTTSQDSAQLRQNIRLTAAAIIACGVDPARSILFQQSRVPQHAELCWLFACLVTESRLKQVPQWKEKAKSADGFSFGLVGYPVLMAADILLYKATHVPVGDDQLQHIQLCRDIAKRFNGLYGEYFPYCDVISAATRRIKSLRDPTKKMSKSDGDPKSRIQLDDAPEKIRESIRKAVTDFTSAVTYNPDQRPGVSNLIDIHSALTGLSVAAILEQTASLDTGAYKKLLAEIVVSYLNPIRDTMQRLLSEPGYIEETLAIGNAKAQAIANDVMADVKKMVGLSL